MATREDEVPKKPKEFPVNIAEFSRMVDTSNAAIKEFQAKRDSAMAAPGNGTGPRIKARERSIAERAVDTVKREVTEAFNEAKQDFRRSATEIKRRVELLKSAGSGGRK